MKNKMQKVNIWTVLKTLFLILILLVVILPFIHMLAVSTSASTFIVRREVTLFPKGATLSYYRLVMTYNLYFNSYKNTIIYVICGVIISMAITSMAAYSLSKTRKMPFIKQLNIFIVFTVLFDGGIIPLFLIVNGLGLLDSMWAVILPGAVNVWFLMIMRTFFNSIPEEIQESAYIDGLNDFQVFLRIILPVSLPILATISLFYAVNLWNAYFWPMIFIQSRSRFPLQVFVRQIIMGFVDDIDPVSQVAHGIRLDFHIEGFKYAIIIMSSIPIIAIYPFLQKYSVKEIMLGAIKT